MKRRSIGLRSFPMPSEGSPEAAHKDEKSVWDPTNSQAQITYDPCSLGRHALRDGGGEVCAGDGQSSCSSLDGLMPNCMGREKRAGWRFSLPGPPSPVHTTTRSHPRDGCKRCKTLRLEPSVWQGGR